MIEVRNERHGPRVPKAIRRYQKRRHRRLAHRLAMWEYRQEVAAELADEAQWAAADYQEWQRERDEQRFADETYHSYDDWDAYYTDYDMSYLDATTRRSNGTQNQCDGVV